MLPLIGRDRGMLEQLKRDWRVLELDRPTRAMLAFAQKATRDPSTVAEADLIVLRSHGLSDVQILDVVLTVAFFNFVNRITSLLGVEPPAPAAHAEAGAP